MLLSCFTSVTPGLLRIVTLFYSMGIFLYSM